MGTPQFDLMNHLCSVHETGMNVMSVEVIQNFEAVCNKFIGDKISI